VSVQGNVKKWANAIASPIVGNLPRDLNDNKNSKWRIEYCYNEQKPNPENSNEGIPQNLDNLKMFPDGTDEKEEDKESTDLKFRTLGLIDGDAKLARDLGAAATQNSFKQNKDGSFEYSVSYNLDMPMPILGAVLSFGAGTSENATYEASAKFDIDDG
jgi:hypothetical protein